MNDRPPIPMEETPLQAWKHIIVDFLEDVDAASPEEVDALTPASDLICKHAKRWEDYGKAKGFLDQNGDLASTTPIFNDPT